MYFPGNVSWDIDELLFDSWWGWSSSVRGHSRYRKEPVRFLPSLHMVVCARVIHPYIIGDRHVHEVTLKDHRPAFDIISLITLDSSPSISNSIVHNVRYLPRQTLVMLTVS